MKIVTLPGTDLKVSRLSLGTASLHHLITSSKRQALLSDAIHLGFTHIDTAPFYGFGLAELELGKFLRSCRQSITVATKIGLYPPGSGAPKMGSVLLRKIMGHCVSRLSKPIIDWSVKRAEESLQISLRRLGRNDVDILFLHEPCAEVINSEEFIIWLEKQRKKGTVRYWGLAGSPDRYSEWIRNSSGLAQILQIPDAILSEGNVVSEMKRPYQITYGCLSRQKRAGHILNPSQAISSALTRNNFGTVIVSSRKINHLSFLAEIAGNIP